MDGRRRKFQAKATSASERKPYVGAKSAAGRRPATAGATATGATATGATAAAESRALQDIRQVQSFMELNYPQRRDAIALLREAGDLVWNEIERMQLQQQQRQ